MHQLSTHNSKQLSNNKQNKVKRKVKIKKIKTKERKRKVLELRLKYLVSILAMSLNYSISSNGAKNLFRVNHLASI